MGHRVKKKVLISDAHSTWSPTGWDLGASRGSLIYLNILLIMVSGHTSSSQGSLEEAANVDSGGHRWNGKRKEEIGKGVIPLGTPKTSGSSLCGVIVYSHWTLKPVDIWITQLLQRTHVGSLLWNTSWTREPIVGKVCLRMCRFFFWLRFPPKWSKSKNFQMSILQAIIILSHSHCSVLKPHLVCFND